MAYLRCFVLLCWIVYVSSIPEEFEYYPTTYDCCNSKCRCDGESTNLHINCDKQDNVLYELPNCPWENATEIILSNNKLEKISKETLRRFKRVETLEMEANNLEFFPDPTVAMMNLKELYVSRNKFKEIPVALSKMPNLEVLDLADNCIKEINEHWKQTKLKTLNLDKNDITKFPRFAARTMPKLDKLTLGYNKIKEIPEAALQNLNSLRTLILSHNDLESLHPEFSGNNSCNLKDFDLSSNRKLSSIPFCGIKKLAHLEIMRFYETNITNIPDFAFKGLMNLAEIELYHHKDTHQTEFQIGNKAFAHLPSLRQLNLDRFNLKDFPDLTGNKALETISVKGNEIEAIPYDLCQTLPNLLDLDITGNRFEHVPKLSDCKNLLVLKMNHNEIRSFGDSVRGLERLLDIDAKFNKISSIGENDLKGLKSLEKLYLTDNEISYIHKNAFSDLHSLEQLLLGGNSFPELPNVGLTKVRTLSIQGNSKLSKFPSRQYLPNIKELHLFYAYHCCAFFMEKRASDNSTWTFLGNDEISIVKWEWHSNSSHPLDDSSGHVELGSSETTTTTTTATPTHPRDKIICTPEPDPFFPCEDLMGDWVLRCGVWFVFVLAVCGNATVIIVILASHTKMDVSRFLISNLAFADLLMGIYLGFLAVVDISTLGNFSSYGVEWQLSPGCRTAGFLATLSSELSVFTLTVITLERYIAIKNAIRVNRKLELKTAIIVMIIGWIYALTTATLPLLEVNSYGKFSVCLPFEIGDTKSLVFLVILLCINAAAFMVILICYILMYCSIRGSNAWNASDFRVAKRMALLVFTDFACWAPIVFFSLTATFGSTLITLSQAKIFTIFVFPLNSCANPFLYAIFTSHFKKDLLAICRRVEDKYPFLKVTKQRMSFSRRSSYSGAISENQNIYLRVRRFSLPLLGKGLHNGTMSISTNGRGSVSSHSNKNTSDTNAVGQDYNEQLLTERETCL